jgi:hypothetical protein
MKIRNHNTKNFKTRENSIQKTQKAYIIKKRNKDKFAVNLL